MTFAIPFASSYQQILFILPHSMFSWLHIHMISSFIKCLGLFFCVLLSSVTISIVAKSMRIFKFSYAVTSSLACSTTLYASLLLEACKFSIPLATFELRVVSGVTSSLSSTCWSNKFLSSAASVSELLTTLNYC